MGTGKLNVRGQPCDRLGSYTEESKITPSCLSTETGIRYDLKGHVTVLEYFDKRSSGFLP